MRGAENGELGGCAAVCIHACAHQLIGLDIHGALELGRFGIIRHIIFRARVALKPSVSLIESVWARD